MGSDVVKKTYVMEMLRYRTEFAKKSFRCSALKAWNNMPAELRELSTFN